MDDSGFVHHGITGSVKGLNAVSLFVWFCIEEGLSPEQIILRLEVEHVALDGLIARGLIDELFLFYRTGKLSEYPEDYAEVWLEQLEPVLFQQASNKYRVFETAFSFSSNDIDIGNMITPLFSAVTDTSTEKSEKGYILKIIEREGAYYVEVNQLQLPFVFTLKQLPCFLFDTVRKLAKKDVDFFAASHAALVEKNDVGIMMPACSGSGKSTLSAVLMSEGFELYTDELVVLDENNDGMAMPLAIGLKEGSWPVLSKRYPELVALPTYERIPKIAIKHLPVKTQWRRVVVNYLVFPKYNSKLQEGVSVAHLTPIESMYRLFEAGFHTAEFLSVDIFEKVLQWVLSIQSISIEFSDVFQASKYLGELPP